MYYTFLTISIVFLFFIYPKIDQCEEKSYGYYGSNNIEGLLASGFLFLILEFIIYSIGGLIILIKKLMKRDVNQSEFRCLVGTISLFFLWFFIYVTYSRNGKCDTIIGPADTGLFLAMLTSVFINLWKLLSITKFKE